MDSPARWFAVAGLGITAMLLGLPMLAALTSSGGMGGLIGLLSHLFAVVCVLGIAGLAAIDGRAPAGTDAALVYEHRDQRFASLFTTPVMLGLGGSSLAGVPRSLYEGFFDGALVSGLFGLAFASVGVLAAFVRRRVQIDPATRILEITWRGPMIALRRTRIPFADLVAMHVEEVAGRRVLIQRLYAGGPAHASVLLYESTSIDAVRDRAQRIAGITGWAWA